MEAWVDSIMKKSVSDSIRKMTRFAKNLSNIEISELNDELRKIDDQVDLDREYRAHNNQRRLIKLNKLALRASSMRDKTSNFLTIIQKLDLGKFKINAFEHHTAHNLLISLTTEIKKLKAIQMEIASKLYLHQDVSDTATQSSNPQPKPLRSRNLKSTHAKKLNNIIFAHIEGKAPAARKRAAEFYVDEA